MMSLRERLPDPENPQTPQKNSSGTSVQPGETKTNSAPQPRAEDQTQQHAQTSPSDSDNVKSGKISDSSDKFWGMYIEEAEKIDNTLVDEWTGTADSILIFSGLFSAVVTSFLIESYASLQPDTSGQLIDALVTISAQLATSNNGGGVVPAYIPLNPDLFRPQATSLWINGLWLSSLTLSLITAVIATLIRQWAASYRHSVTHIQVPHRRGVVRQYLFQGIKRYKMPDVIDFIPLLIQVTLILFLAGLALFLWDINESLSTLVIVLSALSSFTYILFSLGTLFSYKFPYHTPLSRSLLSMSPYFYRVFLPNSPRGNGTKVSEIYRFAAERKSSKVLDKAFKFVLATLSDEKEVERFADSLPGLLENPQVAQEVGSETLEKLSETFLSHQCEVLPQMVDELTKDRNNGDRIATLLSAVSSALDRLQPSSVIGVKGLSESWFNRCLYLFSHPRAEVAQHSMKIYAHLTSATINESGDRSVGDIRLLSSGLIKLLRPTQDHEKPSIWSLLIKCFVTHDPNAAAFIRKAWPGAYKALTTLDKDAQAQLQIREIPAEKSATAFEKVAMALLKRHREDTSSYYTGLSRDILEFVRACHSLIVNPQEKQALENELQIEHPDCMVCKELYQELQSKTSNSSQQSDDFRPNDNSQPSENRGSRMSYDSGHA